MTNGTTRTMTSGAPRLGARIETSTVSHPRTGTPPRATGRATASSTAVPSNTVVTSHLTAMARASPMADLLATAVLPTDLRMSVMPQENGPLSKQVMTMTSGLSRPMALTPTADGANLTTPLRLRATMTSNTLARSGLMMINGPKTMIATTLEMPTATRKPLQQMTNMEDRKLIPLPQSPSRTAARVDMADMESKATATAHGEQIL